MDNWASIRRKIKEYFQGQEDVERLILSEGSDFTTSLDKAMALIFLNHADKERIYKLLRSSAEWNEIINSYVCLQEVYSTYPEVTPFLDKTAMVKFFNLEESKSLTLEEIKLLLTNVPKNALNSLRDYLGYPEMVVALYLNGETFFLKYALEVAVEPEFQHLVYSEIFERFKSQIPPLSVILEEEFMEKFFYELREGIERPEEYRKHNLQKYENKIKDIFKQNILDQKPNVKALYLIISENFGVAKSEKIVREILLESLGKDDQESFGFVYESFFLTKQEELFLMILPQMAKNCLLNFLKQPIDFNILNSLLKYCEAIGSVEVFLWALEVIENSSYKSEISLEKPMIQKICLKAQNSSNTFYLQIWQKLHQKLLINDFKVGNHSFAYWYPEYYSDILEMEQYKLFYTLEDYVKKYKKDRNVVRNVVKNLEVKFSKISKTLKQDILNKSIRQESLQPQDLAVLSSYEEKLSGCLKSIRNMLEYINSPKFSIEELFKTGIHADSIPNLKNFYLGELKVGGLENFLGHSKDLKEIFKSLGFLVNPQVKKEVDHFLTIKSGQEMELQLAETKNLRRVVTQSNSHMVEIQNQKRRLDDNLGLARKDLQNIQLKTTAAIYFIQGISSSAKNKLLTDSRIAEPYNEVRGLVFDFKNLSSVTQEFFEDLCKILNQKKQQQIDMDLYKTHINGIAHSLLMVEEDQETELSYKNQYSQTIQKNLKQMKITLDKYNLGAAKDLFLKELLSRIQYLINVRERSEEYA